MDHPPFVPPAATDTDAPIAAEDDPGRAGDALAAAEENRGGNERWWAWLGFALAVVLIALAERTLFFQPYNIPSGSMEDTLLVGDYLMVEKFAYGYSRFSLPLGRFLPAFGRVLAHPPARGDVVVFVPPGDHTTAYIKRLVGLPGDRIRVTDGVLYINDVAVPKVRVSDFRPDDGRPPVARFRETLPGGVSYDVLDAVADGPEDNTQTYTVPVGHYFMMGDNRDDSNDSRMDVGFVPAENLVGKALIRFFSIDDKKTHGIWPFAVRFERMFGFVT